MSRNIGPDTRPSGCKREASSGLDWLPSLGLGRKKRQHPRCVDLIGIGNAGHSTSIVFSPCAGTSRPIASRKSIPDVESRLGVKSRRAGGGDSGQTDEPEQGTRANRLLLRAPGATRFFRAYPCHYLTSRRVFSFTAKSLAVNEILGGGESSRDWGTWHVGPWCPGVIGCFRLRFSGLRRFGVEAECRFYE